MFLSRLLTLSSSVCAGDHSRGERGLVLNGGPAVRSQLLRVATAGRPAWPRVGGVQQYTLALPTRIYVTNRDEMSSVIRLDFSVGPFFSDCSRNFWGKTRF